MIRLLLHPIAALAILAIGYAANAAPIEATSADDICASDANPCVITDVVRVAPNAALDFGTREVNITGHGRLDFGSSSGQILCGPLTASTDAVAILAAGRTDGGMAGGVVGISARRACSAGSPTRACLTGFDCQLGTCSARRCSERSSVQCTADAGCSGTCTNRRCSNSVPYLGCAVNADCSFGTCADQLTCSGTAGEIRNCSADGDCDFGTCSVGEGSIIVEGSIEGGSASPAVIVLQASDSVTLRGAVDLSSTRSDGYGGELDVTARAGDVVIEGAVRARGGSLGAGGYLSVSAGRDVIVAASMNMSGGGDDGGVIDISADRDVTVDSDINLSATAGGGWSGVMEIAADRNITIGSGPTRRRITANGHSDGESYGGGGQLSFDAGGDVLIAQGVEIRARGARNGVAGYIAVDAGGDFELNGRIRARTGGREGSGGLLVVNAIDDLTFGESAVIDLRAVYGGTAELYTEKGDSTFNGSVLIGGPFSGETGWFSLEACRVTLAGSIASNVEGSYSSIVAHESMRLLSGSSMRTPKGGNTLAYRATEKPPVIEGTVTPAPLLMLLDYLDGCPVCGNSEIDESETCDDGNTTAGDGCDDSCRLE